MFRNSFFGRFFVLKNRSHNKELDNLTQQFNSRPCPACGEELERMDRCLNDNCKVDLTYYNGICYSIDEAESLA